MYELVNRHTHGRPLSDHDQLVSFRYWYSYWGLLRHWENGFILIGWEQANLSYAVFVCFQGEKKLVRYRNNQVASTKGERFSYVKQEEHEEMKKTYVNIKPTRKYRFHWVWNSARVIMKVAKQYHFRILHAERACAGNASSKMLRRNETRHTFQTIMLQRFCGQMSHKFVYPVSTFFQDLLWC